jgi:AcrR family transcriptional regulator
MARPLSEEARAKMLAAAQAVIADVGLDACTVDEVARRSGVAKTTIYRHFGSVDELIIAAVDATIEEVAAPDHGSLRADLRALIDAFTGIVRQPGFRALFASMLTRSIQNDEFACVYQQAQEARHAPLRIALQRGIARGEVDPEVDLDVAMYLVQGPFLAKRLVEGGELGERELDQYLDLIERALAPTG